MYRCYNEGEERGDSYGLRKSITLFLLQLIIAPNIFDSVYIKVTELLTIYKENFFEIPNCIYP